MKYLLLCCPVFFLLLVGPSFTGCRTPPGRPGKDSVSITVDPGKKVVLNNGKLELEFDRRMGCRIYYDSARLAFNEPGDSIVPPQYLVSGHQPITDFQLDFDQISLTDIEDHFGRGKQLTLQGKNAATGIRKKLIVSLYDQFKDAVIWRADYSNFSNRSFTLTEAVSNSFLLNPSLTNKSSAKDSVWTYQGIALDWGMDYMFPLKPGFSRENYTGLQPVSRMGGGVPLIDCWNREMGFAIAHLSKKPLLLSMPTRMRPDGKIEISIKQPVNLLLAPGETYQGLTTVAIAHHLDFYDPLAIFSALMKDQGLAMQKPSPETYQPFWCGWGYESDFTLKDIYGTLPKIRELGIKWIVIDDRWFDRYGDWNPRKKIFPGGEKQMKQFVDSLHKMGFLTKIWWAPILAQPAAPPPGGKWPSHDPGASDLVKKHPDWLVKDASGNFARCPRNMYFLNPSLPAVQDYIRKLTHKFIADWGFDGHKLDAFWVVPPHFDSTGKSSAASYETEPELFRIIYETSKSLKPYSVTEICNCGTPQDFYQSLYIDQPVVADPTSFTQVRFRVKAFKALWGNHAPVFTDHVEHVSTFTDPIVHDVEDNDKSPDDFASTVGTGGVPGTKFTWPGGSPSVNLSPEREEHWKKWLGLYQNKMLSQGEYLNLYDLAHDLPETHVIQKGTHFFYAFYNKNWSGKAELRGLGNADYDVFDYVNNQQIGRVHGPTAQINLHFTRYSLLECIPVKK